jgi:hypothetical protein
MERFSYNGRKERKWWINQCLFPQELSGMVYWNVARMIQSEKSILKGGLRQDNNTMKILIS